MSTYKHKGKAVPKKKNKVVSQKLPVDNMAAIKVYTDGGTHITNPGIGSFAYVVTENDVVLHEYSELAGWETNNRMELCAVLHCLNWLSIHAQNLPVIIYSDSQYVVNGVTQWRFGWARKNWVDVKNVDLWQQIAILADSLHNVKFQWVRGHNGNRFNEMADQMCTAMFADL